MTVPPLAVAATPGADAELIDLCDCLVSAETEQCLLCEHDEHAPDFGPNNRRYEHLLNKRDRLIELIDECNSPTIPAGHTATACAALTWVDLDHERNFKCDDFGEEMMLKLAQGGCARFRLAPASWRLFHSTLGAPSIAQGDC
jgi:hypothetical protein